MVNIRLIESKDVFALHPKGLRDTVIGWAVDKDDELVAIAGVARRDGIVIAFSKIKDGVKIPALTIVKTAIKLNKLICSLPYPVIYALTYDGKLLRALGWQYLETRENWEVYKCKPQK